MFFSTYNGYVLNICDPHACLPELLRWLWCNRSDKGVFLSDKKQQSYIGSFYFLFGLADREYTIMGVSYITSNIVLVFVFTVLTIQ